MDNKERSRLGGLAQSIQPIFQIGKNGITDIVIKELNDALEARELIKITVLKNSELDSKEVMAELCQKLEAEPISAIGFKIVIFRKSRRPKK
ncbi:MAG: YhbY family RNA-binding protein [Clostridia bacterium]|nr:YhbY family RNA-binding protein [Clostridia bacterium]